METHKQQTAVELLIRELKLDEIFTPEAWRILQPIVEEVKRIEAEQLADRYGEGYNEGVYDALNK